MEVFLTRDSIVRVKVEKTDGKKKKALVPIFTQFFNEPKAGYIITDSKIMYRHKDNSLVKLHIDCPHCKFIHG